MNSLVLGLLVLLLTSPSMPAFAGTSAQAQAPAPTVVRLDGEVRTDAGTPRTGPVNLVISVYAEETDVNPLWTETQSVNLDDAGRYTVYVGATLPEGMPAALFAGGQARWVGVTPDGAAEGPRTRLLSVAYAANAVNAETLGGAPASAFVMSENLAERVKDALKGPDGTASGGEAGIMVSSVGRIAKFSDTNNTTVDSIIYESAGKIGINNATPSVTFDVNGHQAIRGQMFMGDGTSSDFRKLYANTPMYVRNSGGTIEFTIDGSGRVGIGNSTPSVSLDVNGHVAIRGQMFMGDGTSADFRKLNANTTLNFRRSDGTVEMSIDGSGNVSVNGNIGAKYQDVAEWVETGEPLEFGTVVIVDPNGSDRVIPSPGAYDTRVAGAVSRQPGLILGEKGDTKSQVAQSGRVRIKVDATYGAIKPGDLLVTSPTPGHAMLSKPMKVGKQLMHRPGTLVGKALEALPNGKGEILVLLTLQ